MQLVRWSSRSGQPPFLPLLLGSPARALSAAAAALGSPQFAGSREATLLESCAEALAQCDEKKFATAVAEFDALTRLDGWKTNMLLRVKRRIQARQAGEDLEDEEPELL